MTSFLDSIDGLSVEMRKTATHLGACLKKTHPAHVAYGVLSRLERVCFDTATQFDLLLSPEVRTQLANVDAEK